MCIEQILDCIKKSLKFFGVMMIFLVVHLKNLF